MSKTPGILTDPWRQDTPPVAPPKEPPPTPNSLAGEQDPDISSVARSATLELKGYGGITVEGFDTLTEAAAHILAFCIQHLPVIEDRLISYGVLVAKLDAPAKAQFYVQRKDGWTLALPEARDRDEGLLSLIQALSHLQSDTTIHTAMKDAHIRPFVC